MAAKSGFQNLRKCWKIQFCQGVVVTCRGERQSPPPELTMDFWQQSTRSSCTEKISLTVAWNFICYCIGPTYWGTYSSLDTLTVRDRTMIFWQTLKNQCRKKTFKTCIQEVGSILGSLNTKTKHNYHNRIVWRRKSWLQIHVYKKGRNPRWPWGSKVA
jgi:hypothetical protein